MKNVLREGGKGREGYGPHNGKANINFFRRTPQKSAFPT